MKIKLLTNTRFKGNSALKDTIIEVDAVTGARWVGRKIAEEINVISAPSLVSSENVENSEITFSKFSSKELYEQCIEKGIKTEPRQSKQTYIDLLESGA